MKKLVDGSLMESCPWCGGYNLKHSIYMSGGVMECGDCGVTGPEVEPDYDVDRAIEAWNARKAQEDFMVEFRELCSRHGARFYTTDDNGIHIEVRGEEVCRGFLE